MALSLGFAQRMIGGSAAAHSACSVSVNELVATQTGSAAATSERAYELSAAEILGFICGLSGDHVVGRLCSRVCCRFLCGLGDLCALGSQCRL
jgi:hypothetical protein